MIRVHHKNLKSGDIVEEKCSLPQEKGFYNHVVYTEDGITEYRAVYITDSKIGYVLSVKNSDSTITRYKVVTSLERIENDKYTNLYASDCIDEESFMDISGQQTAGAELHKCDLRGVYYFNDIRIQCDSYYTWIANLCYQIPYEYAYSDCASKYYIQESYMQDDNKIELYEGSFSDVAEKMRKDDKSSIIYPSLIVIFAIILLF